MVPDGSPLTRRRTVFGRTLRPVPIASALGVWVVIAMLAVFVGLFREGVLDPVLGESGAHVASTALLVVSIVAVSAVYFARTATRFTRFELVVVGVLWAALAVAFEFAAGSIAGLPAEVTLSQYDVFDGDVWVVVPVTLLLAPPFFGSLLRGESTLPRSNRGD